MLNMSRKTRRLFEKLNKSSLARCEAAEKVRLLEKVQSFRKIEEAVPFLSYN